MGFKEQPASSSVSAERPALSWPPASSQPSAERPANSWPLHSWTTMFSRSRTSEVRAPAGSKASTASTERLPDRLPDPYENYHRRMSPQQEELDNFTRPMDVGPSLKPPPGP